jgi:RelA/SpoT family (p)ppGpp synthetase
MVGAAEGTLPQSGAVPAAPLLFARECEDLLKKTARYNPQCDRDMLRRAFDCGAKAHDGQTRDSGLPYFTHPIAVADILADLHLDDATLATALLHDVVEDTEITRADLARDFGTEIADLVTGVTKLSKIERREQTLDTREEAQAENFRKLILAVAEDARVLLVKLADRMHNMRTLGNLSDERRHRIARETMEVYAPLAGRMGMQAMREELEDLAMRTLVPGARVSVLRRFARLRREHGELVLPNIVDELRSILSEGGIEADVDGRQKRPYSIWRKMEREKVGFENLSDLAGFRVVTQTIDDCYRALGIIHQRWKVVPGRFKDYISNPKGNGYSSLHTTVINRSGWRIEVQLRTREMQEAAEGGVAAHWSYKDGVRASNPYAVGPTLWLKDVLQKLERGAPPTEFLEHVKMEMYHDQVFCFTPRGDVKAMPRGATVLDFAYAVHTEVGNQCVGARIDGHRAPLWKPLRNGQTVELLRSEGQYPLDSWEDMVVTGRAKSGIRRALKERARGELHRFGQQLLRRTFTKAGYELRQEDLDRVVAALDFDSHVALFIAIGQSDVTAEAVFEAADPARESSREIALSEEPVVMVRGADGSPAHSFCTVCNPIPFERIVGVQDRRDGGAILHRIDCPELAKDDDNADKWLDMFWGENADSHAKYPVSLSIILANEPGALGAVCTGVGALEANIVNLSIAERKPSYWRVKLDLEVRDARHLHKILKTLDNQPRVDQVDRISAVI